MRAVKWIARLGSKVAINLDVQVFFRVFKRRNTHFYWVFSLCVVYRTGDSQNVIMVVIGHCMKKKWTNVINFTYAATFTFTSWPQMTFDLGMWPLTSLTYKGFHFKAVTKVWYKIGFIWVQYTDLLVEPWVVENIGRGDSRAQYFSNSWRDQ